MTKKDFDMIAAEFKHSLKLANTLMRSDELLGYNQSAETNRKKIEAIEQLARSVGMTLYRNNPKFSLEKWHTAIGF